MRKYMSLFQDFKWRNLFYDVTDPELEKALENEKMTFYMGVDPTADSLHVGHLFACMVVKRLQSYGHQPILVIGGGTGLIGDPSFNSVERPLLTIQESLKNAEGLKKQLTNILPGVKFVNNYDWLSSLNAIEFLRDIGKNFNVSYMINKESVKSRIETGISFTEFAYTIIQAWDFEHLFHHYHCHLQIGGQDQWGNITSGLELIRKLHGSDAKAYGFTFPLVTKADGSKFGKTGTGTLWLDPLRTSPYEFYQFWINTADEDVISRLKQFTFLSKADIEAVENDFLIAPHKRSAQKVLAKEMTTLIHGEQAFQEAMDISEALFSGEIHRLSASEIAMGFSNLIACDLKEARPLIDILVEAKLATSKRDARELVSKGAILVNGIKMDDLDQLIDSSMAIEGQFTVIRKGKKTYAIIRHRQ
jgi:tyrosyl-tRNA synthetase